MEFHPSQTETCPVTESTDSRLHGTWPIGMKLVLAVTAGALITILILAGYHAFPMPTTDTSSFIVTSVRYREGHGLTNPVAPVRLLDPTGQDRVLAWPPLFVWLLGLLMPFPSVRSAFLVIAVMRAVLILGWGYIFMALLRAMGFRPTWGFTALVCIALLGIGSNNAMPTEGRPEALGSVLILAGAFSFIYLCGWPRVACFAVLLGLLGATHPVSGILGACLMSLIVATESPGWEAFLRVLVLGVGSLLIFVLVLAASPFDLAEFLRISSSAGQENFANSWGPWQHYLFLSGRTPFIGMLLIATVLASLYLLSLYYQHIRSLILFTLSGVAFLVCSWYFAIRGPARIYYLSPFVPVCYFILLAAWLHLRDLFPLPPKVQFAFRIGLMTAMFLPALGVLRYGTYLGVYLAEGTTWGSARAQLHQYLSQNPADKIFTNDYWVFFDNYAQVDAFGSGPELAALLQRVGTEDKLVVLLPVYPNNVDGYLDQLRLVEVYRSPTHQTPSWAPHWTAGYAFRLYAFQKPHCTISVAGP